MVSPGGFIATSSRASGDMHEQIIDLTDSSMCSLLKSGSDIEFTTSNGSEDDDKESGPTRPTLPDPFWLTNVDVTPQVFYRHLVKSPIWVFGVAPRCSPIHRRFFVLIFPSTNLGSSAIDIFNLLCLYCPLKAIASQI